jgi:sugar lactone lactonase YvrE
MMGPELHVLTTGIGFGESPRWHEGRLWRADWSAKEILAVDLVGARSPLRLGRRVRELPDLLRACGFGLPVSARPDVLVEVEDVAGVPLVL